MLFTPFHVPHLVCLTARGEQRRGQTWPSSARLDTGPDKSGLLLATPPHWPGQIKEEKDLGRANPLPPEGLTAGKRVALRQRRAGQRASRLAWRDPVLDRTPWSSLCPPLLGPGGPSQQVSFLLVIRLDPGHPPASLPVSLYRNFRSDGVLAGMGGGRRRGTPSSRGGQEAPARARRS